MVVAMNDSTSVHSCSTRQNWNTPSPLLYQRDTCMIHAFPRTSLYSELLIQWCALSLIVMHLFRPRSVYHDNWTTENGKFYYKNMYIIIGSSALPASQYSCWNSPTSSALHQSREYEVRKDDCTHYCYHSHIRTIQTMQVCFYYSLVSNLCMCP